MVISLVLINSKLVYAVEGSESAEDPLNFHIDSEKPNFFENSTDDAKISDKKRWILKRNSSSSKILDQIINNADKAVVEAESKTRSIRDSMSSSSSLSFMLEGMDVTSSTPEVNHNPAQNDRLFTIGDSLIKDSQELLDHIKTFEQEKEDLETESKKVHYGSHAQVDAKIGTALGFQALVHESAVNSTALGDYSEADKKNVVSIGSSTSRRKIIHVENGRRNSDAATVGQVKSMAVLYDEISDDPEFNKITLAKKPDENKLVRISGLAPAKSENDAVNQGQINNLIMHITQEQIPFYINRNMENAPSYPPIYIAPEIPGTHEMPKTPASILMSGRRISGVEDGEKDSDVVVVGQLSRVFTGIIETINSAQKATKNLIEEKIQNEKIIKFDKNQKSVSFVSEGQNPVILKGIAKSEINSDAVNREELHDKFNSLDGIIIENTKSIRTLDSRLGQSLEAHTTLREELPAIIQDETKQYKTDLNRNADLFKLAIDKLSEINKSQGEIKDELKEKISKNNFYTFKNSLEENVITILNKILPQDIIDLPKEVEIIKRNLISPINNKKTQENLTPDNLTSLYEGLERSLSDKVKSDIDNLSGKLNSSIETIRSGENSNRESISQLFLTMSTSHSPTLSLSQELSDVESQPSDNEDPRKMHRSSTFLKTDHKKAFSPYPTFSAMMLGKSDISTDSFTTDDLQPEDSSFPFLSIEPVLANSNFQTTTFSGKDTVAETTQAVLADKDTVADAKQAVLDDEVTVAETTQAVLADKVTVAETKQAVLADKDTVADAKQAVLDDEVTVAETTQAVLADKVTVAETKQAVLADKDTVADAKQAVLDDEVTVAETTQAVLADKVTVAETKQAVLADKDTVADAKQAVLADEVTVAETTQAVLADKVTVAETKQAVLADKDTVADAKQAVLDDEVTVAETTQAVLADKVTVAETKQAVLADKDTVADAKQTVLADKDTVADAKQTILADKDTVAETKQAVLADEATVAHVKQQMTLAFEGLTKNMAISAFPSGNPDSTVIYDTDKRDSLTLGGINKTPVQVHNVAPGDVSPNSTDAVNGAQLFQYTNFSINQSMQYTDQRFSEIQQDMNEMGQNINEMRQSINSVASHAYSGVAAAMAMPSMGPVSPGRTMVSVGTASFKGRKATGVGVTYRSRGGQVVINAAASKAGSDTGMRVQLGYEF
ncbi:YadA-like family protein [Mycoavidus sp. B2-EB]|uniref:YadA family autotransporter adhesin n=1 Tax=Mycoavidus sp. B2-EB TaxID=2651972 RepID=UPI0016272569|nr:YadA-like family protein [Mycoavidus sp. B2-EB]